MADQALPEQNQELVEVPTTHAAKMERRDIVRQAAAKLYGQSIKRPQIARILVDHLVPNNRDRPLEQRLSQARTRLAKWERDPKFRDLIYNLAVVKLDLQAPEILGGIAKKAKRGRVDAARLALEITGRHNPKGDQQPAQVALIIQGVPRPSSVQAVTAEGKQTVEITDGDLAVEEDDEV